MTAVGRDELLAMRDRCNDAYCTTNSKIAQLALVDAADLLHRLAGVTDAAAVLPTALAEELDATRTRCRRATNTTNSKSAQNALGAAADLMREIGCASAEGHTIANPDI